MQNSIPSLVKIVTAMFVIALASPGFGAPVIVTSPQGGNAECSSNFTFSVTASGTEPLTYQWKHAGTNLPGATSSSLTVVASAQTGGSYEVDVTDVDGTATGGPAVLSVTDTIPPSITCPANIVTGTDAAQCSASVTYAASATDLCSANPTVVCSPVSGSTFALGTSTVTCTATDEAGNTNSCTFNVTVNDTEAPSITAPANVTICADPGQDYATGVALGSPTTGDNCSVANVGNNAPTQFPVGNTTVTWTVTDGSGNPAMAAQTVTVNPNPSVSVNSVKVCAGGSAVLTATTDAVSPSYLWDNGATTASITVSPASTTTYSCTVTDGTSCSGSGSGTVTVHGFDNFANTGAITINDLAAASPYPSPITVSGLTATVCRVTVTLNGLSHDFPDDLDIALMGPDGQVVLLMSDVGNGFGLSGVNLTFDDMAASGLPNAGQIVGGTFKPSNFGAKSDGNPDNFPAPAPTIRYFTNLSVFNGINPNGVWSLFAYDDELVDAGQIAGGWSMAISTIDPIADVGISQLDIPDPVAVGSNLTYTVVVTNHGPALATGVLVSDTPPAGATLVSFGASQGSCTLVSGTVWCDIGSIAPNGSATISVVVSPTGAGTLVNTASVQSDDVDFNSANNSSAASTTVLNPPVITTGPQDLVVCADQTATFTVTASGEPPLSYQWYFGIDPISGANSSTLTLTAVQPAASGGYAVIVQNNVGATSASANLTVNPLPTVTIGAAPSTTICLGASVTLTANNNASNPSYLWTPGGATTASIDVSPTSTSSYSVLVTDGATSCTNSASTTITVDQPTTATALTSVTNQCPGTSVSFSTTAGGTGPHTYVWSKNGNVVAGETGPSLTFASVAAGDAGTYCVEVTGVCNSVTNCATLTVAAPPTIASQPQSISRPMGSSGSFSVTATGPAPITYQWLLNGSPIDGQTGTTLNVPSLTLAHNGNQYSVVVSNCAGAVTSAAATLTVTPIAGISFDFDTPGQYTNTPYNVQLNDWLNTLLPSLMVEMPFGGVNNSGAIDLQGAADSSTQFHPLSYDFSQDGKTLVAAVMVRIVAPTQNNRATQIGFITATNAYAGTAPGITGAGINDNNPIGFMTVILQSTAQPALTYQLRLQHRRTDGGITEVTPTPTPQATLTAGNWYKLVATFQNISATAANTIAISASLQDMGNTGLLPGSVAMSYPPTNIVNTSMVTQRNVHLALRSARSDTGADFWDNVYAYATAGPIFFVAQPSGQTVQQGDRATFTALVDGAGPYTYQWSKNGSPIAGARNWKYITGPTRLSENGDQYTVTVTGPDSTTITSDPATLTVQADTLQLVSVGSVDGCSIGVQFNQPVDTVSAANPANYLINGTAAASARVYTSTADPTTSRVILTPASVLTGPYTVTVANVNDLSGNPIGAINSANGRIEGLVGVDINPVVAAPSGQNYSFAPGQLEVIGGGADIFTAPDSFRYVQMQKSGDFDVKVRVPYQDVMRTPTKTGFDARVSLDPAAPHVLAAVNPRWPARSLYEGTHRQAYNVGGTSWGAAGTPVRYPDAWLRFRRVGNTFMRYSSQNGTAWQLDGQFSPSPAFPETLYLGLAVCSVGNNNPQTASFDNYGDFAGYPGATIAITTQPVGSATVAAGGSTNLAVTATITGAPAAGELSYVWQRHAGGGVWTNVIPAGATNNVFNTGALFAADTGAEYRVIVKAPGAADVTSDTTTVTVTDTAVPTISAATIPIGSTFQVLVTFSEPVSAATALDSANYTVTNMAGGANIGVASVTFLGDDRRTVLLNTANPLVLGAYGARISGVQDLAGNTMAVALRNLGNAVTAPATGPVVVEFYTGLTNAPGLSDLTNNVTGGNPAAKFANDGPDFVTYSNVFGVNPTAGNFAASVDHYGAQIYAYFVPPTNGNYKFFVRADDFAEFRMNTNAVGSTNPAGAVVQVTLAANAQAYTLANSVTNNLIAGNRYYLELRFKESTGGDGGTVAVRNDNTLPGQGEVIPASLLAFPDAVAKPTPVVVELYTGQVTVNSILPNDLGAAFGNGGYPDLLASANTAAFVARTPNVIGYARYFGFNSNLVQINATFDNYLGRIYGNFVAPSNGVYKFYTRSDDSCQLWMNTNAVNSADPAGITLLGRVTDFYDVNQRLIAENVYLNGGQSYYMEGRWREGTGGDGMTVTFRAQSDLSIPPNTEMIAGNRLQFPTNYDRVGPADAILTPLNPVVAQGGTITFQAGSIRGMTPYGIQWLKNGAQIGANTTTFTTQPLTASDNGATFTLVVSNLFSRAERSTTITVVPDNTAPTIAGAVGSQYQDLVVLTFDEPLDVASACVTPYYQIDNGLQVYSASIDQGTRRRVTLRTSPQTPGTTYTVTVNGVRDPAGNAIAANTGVAFTAWIAAGKGFYVEVWTNIAGTAVANLTTDAKYINNVPDSTFYTNRLGAGWFGNDTGLNNWGVRLTGLFSPPTNGLYRFYVRGDDGTQIHMNTNGPDASGRVLVARNDGANSGTWENGVGGSATPILTLNADTLYFMEVFMKEGGGGDHLEVLLRAINPDTLTPITGLPAPSVNDIVTGDFFVAMGNPDRAQLTVVQTPATEITVAENDTVTLSARAYAPNFELSQATGYRWQVSNGAGGYANIAGEIGPTFTFVAPASDTEYRVVIGAPGTNAVYSTLVHSSPDTKAPFMLSASSLNGTNLDVLFNEPLESSSAVDPFNYSVNEGAVNITGIVHHEDRRKVTISVDAPVGPTFTIFVSGVVDLANNFDVSTIEGSVSSGFVALDIGAPIAPGSTFNVAAGEFDVVAGGNDIWGTADVGHLTMTQVTGDFDVHARLAGLTRPDPVTKAGLMVRETLDAGSRTLHTMGNPAQYQESHPLNAVPLTGRDLGEAAVRFAANNGTAGWQARPESIGNPSQLGNSGFAPVGIPNAWLRIKREGNLFSAFHSYDGVNWRLYAQAPFSYPRTVYLGFGTTAHTAAQAVGAVAVANYRDVYIPPAPVIIVQPTPSTQTVPMHASVSYSVVASNPPPNVSALKYQWLRNGVAIANATSDSLTISDVLPGDAGIYTVEVNNDGGTTTSVPVTLNVDSGLVAGADTLNTTQNTALNIAASTLLANDSAAAGDTASIVAVSGIFPVTYASDFNGGLPAGATIFGTTTVEPAGGVDNSGMIRLNAGAGNAGGSLILNDLSPNRRVTAFTASFKLRIGDGSAEPADGFSFNFARDLPIGATTPAAAENGGGSGFSFCVDNYRFHPYPQGNIANTSGLKIRYGNLDVAGVRTATWNTPRWVDVSITITPQGVATVMVDGTNVFGNIQLPNYVPTTGRFGWYGRTGGQFQSHAIDDVSITSLLTIETTREPAVNTDAERVIGSAVINGGILRLTEALASLQGSYQSPILNTQAMTSLTANFDVRIGGGTARAADGFSLAIAPDLPNASFGEEGAGSYLIVSLDTWDNGGTDTAPSFDVKWGGTGDANIIATQSFQPSARYQRDPARGGATATPPLLDGLGNPVLLDTDVGSTPTFVPVSVTVESDGTLDLSYKGVPVFQNLAIPGFYGATNLRVGVGGRTGGATDNHWVDNLSVTINTAEGPVVFNNDFSTTPPTPYGTVVLSGSQVIYTPPANVCGTDTFYYLISGQNGGSALGRVDVNITEGTPTPPTITACASNRVLEAGIDCTATLADMTAEVRVVDNCCCVGVTQNPPAGTLLPPGSHVVTFTATDTAGLTSQCQATVTVVDTIPPVIAVVGGSPLAVECHSGFVDPGATASDNCDGNITSSIVVSGSVNPDVPGTYTLTYNVSDAAGNPAAEMQRIVNVADTTPPAITCPANITAFRSTTNNGEYVYYCPSATDACDASATLVCTPPSGTFFPLGTTTVACTATDDTGNSSGCSFSVTVKIANILFVSDNPTTGDNAFHPPLVGFPDDFYVQLLQSAGHNVGARFNPPNAATTLLTAQQLADINTNDLILVSRSIGSGAFVNAQASNWNARVTKPLIMTSPYLVRQDGNRLFWFVGGNGVLPDTTPPTRMRAMDTADPETLFLFDGVAMSGDTMVDSFDERNEQNTSTITNPPTAGGKQLATATFVPLAGGAAATANIITEFPAGTAVPAAVGGSLGGYRMFFAAGTREIGATGIPLGAGRDNLTPAGENIFMRAIRLALNNGVAPIDFCSPLSFVTQPVDVTVEENRPAAFSVSLAGAPPRTVQWQRDTGDATTFTNIPGASGPWLNSSYTIASATPAHAGYYRVVASNPFGTITSTAAQLTVNPDVIAPTIVRAVGKWTLTNVTVSFSEPITVDSAIDVLNYSADNGLSIDKATLDATGTNVFLETSLQTPGTVYTISISGIQDRAAVPNMIAANSPVQFTAWIQSHGFWISELFLDIPGNAVPNLTTNAKYPNFPDRWNYVNISSNPPAQGENYGGRLVGWVIPPVDGTYTFYIRGDDGNALLLSPSADPAARVLVASNSAANTAYTTLPEGTQTLVGGQRYFIEALWKEGTGGDYVQVAWQTPLSAAIEAISCEYMEQYANPEGILLNIVSHPQNADVFENRTVTFSVGANIAPASLAAIACYEWQRGDGLGGFTNIHARNVPTYTTPVLRHPEDDGSLWRVMVSVPGATAISLVATVSVRDDIVGPIVLSTASLDDMSIGVCFDEAVTPDTAVDLFNYGLTEGSLTVTGAVLRADGRSVHLKLDGPLPPAAELMVSGVLDLAGNAMDPVSVLPLRHGLTAQDIGGPGLAGSHFTCDGDIELVGGGTDIWGNSDMAYLAHRSVTGDFDARVRVKSLVGSDPITKASLMVRETTAGGSRAINLNVNPPNGRNQFEAGQRLTTGGATAAWGPSIPAGVPNAWLRITRTGNNWAGYHSTNGVDWTLAAQVADAYPGTVVLGLAVTAHNNTLLATGVFSGFVVSQPQADVAITKLDAPDPAYVGGNVTYTLSVTNAGPGTATGAVVTDVLPAATTFVSATSSQGTCVNNAGTVTCNLGTLNVGGSATITIVVNATTVGTNSNTATVTSAASDPDAANNSATALTRVIGHPSVTGSTYAGGTFGASFQSEAGYTYEVRYKNNLQDPNWTLLTTIAGDGTVKSFSDPDAGAQPHRFYIILVP